MLKLGTKVDDMFKAWTKADDAARIEGVKRLGLPENNTALDRAKAMGFDTKAYHGTGEDFTGFSLEHGGSASNMDGSLGIFSSNNPDVANMFAKQSWGTPKNYPLALRQKKSWNPDGYGDITNLVDQHIISPYKPKFVGGERIRRVEDTVDVPKLQKSLTDEGYDSVKISNTKVDSPDGKTRSDQYVTLDPANIRSPLAHFNPKYAGIGAGSILSANLMADELNLEHKPKVSAWDSLMNTIGGVNQQQAQAYGDTGAGAFNLAGDIMADPSVVAELGMKGIRGTGLGAILQSNEVQAAEKPDFFQQLQRQR